MPDKKEVNEEAIKKAKEEYLRDVVASINNGKSYRENGIKCPLCNHLTLELQYFTKHSSMLHCLMRDCGCQFEVPSLDELKAYCRGKKIEKMLLEAGIKI